MDNLNILNSNNLKTLESSNYKIIAYTPSNDALNLNFNIIQNSKLIESNNISLLDSHKLNSLIITSTINTNTNLKIFISPNNGNEWYSYIDNNWSVFSKTKENIKNNRMSISQINSLTSNQWEQILNQQNRQLKFLFYLENNTDNDNDLTIDSLILNLDLKGLYRSVSKNITYICDFIDNNVCKISLLESGTYKINY